MVYLKKSCGGSLKMYLGSTTVIHCILYSKDMIMKHGQ